MSDNAVTYNVRSSSGMVHRTIARQYESFMIQSDVTWVSSTCNLGQIMQISKEEGGKTDFHVGHLILVSSAWSFHTLHVKRRFKLKRIFLAYLLAHSSTDVYNICLLCVVVSMWFGSLLNNLV